MDKVRCQSCGMPLGPGFYGLNADGTVNQEYCKFCFENGEFKEPNMTLEQMLGRSMAHMVDEEQMGEKEAQDLATSTIPKLKRWAQSQ